MEAAAAQPLVQEPLSFLQELESYPSNATRERFQFLVKFKGRSFLHLQWLGTSGRQAGRQAGHDSVLIRGKC